MNSATKAEFRHSGVFGCLGKLLNAKKVTALKPLWNKLFLATGGEGAVQWEKSFGEIKELSTLSNYTNVAAL